MPIEPKTDAPQTDERKLPEATKPPRVTQADKGDKKQRRWDQVDEQSWESFPASDPPGNY